MDSLNTIAIGQRFCVGLPGMEIDSETEALIRKYKIGNVILFRRNIRSREQLATLCFQLRLLIASETGIEPFIIVDQEGGESSVLSEDFANIPSAMALRASDNPENARFCGWVTGKELSSVGVNVDLAPILDVNSNPNNPSIGVRSYGEDAEEVTSFGMQMAKGLAGSGILCCAGHFPGHGDSSVDSHLQLPIVQKTMGELEKLELVPFKKAILDRIPMVMTAHIVFPNIDDSGLPATMSKKILVDLLRDKMKFEGIVLTGCMEKKAIADYFGTVPSAVQALENGADIALFSNHASLAADAISKIYEKKIDESVLMMSYKRILTAKVKTFSKNKPVNGAIAMDYAAIDKIGLQSVTECNIPENGLPPFGRDPLFIGCSPSSFRPSSFEEITDFSFSEAMSAEFGGVAKKVSPNPDLNEIHRIIKEAGNCTSIVLATANGHIRRGQLDLGLALENLGKPMIVVAMGSPYDLAFFSASTATIAIYEYTRRSLRWLVSYFSGQTKKLGKPFFSLDAQEA